MKDHGHLLGTDDPAPVGRFNSAGGSPFLLVADHAGVAIPGRLKRLGLDDKDLARHIACDIGVLGLGEMLADRLDAALIHQAYSRLVIDCNRDPASPEAIPTVSDATPIPGNLDLSDDERAARVALIHAPYQRAIADCLAARAGAGRATILVSLHSFTPVMAGERRPWEIGVLHDGGDTAFARTLLDVLRDAGGARIGDNEPYVMDATDHTVPRHAYAARLPYAELEIRQDLIVDAADIALLSRQLADALLEAWRRLSRS